MTKTDYPVARQFHANTSYIDGKLPGPGVLNSGVKPFKEYPGVPRVKLQVETLTDMNFQDTLLERHSCRKFSAGPIPLSKLSNILFAAYGNRNKNLLNDEEWTERTVPSAGGLYPLEFYTLALNVDGLEAGIYHYLPLSAQLECIHPEVVPPQLLNRLFFQQSWVTEAAAIIIATGVVERTLSKYLDRGYRYILLEAGHAFQNMNLMAAACKLGAVNVGAFFDEEVGALLKIIPEEELPIYAVVLGVERRVL